MNNIIKNIFSKNSQNEKAAQNTGEKDINADIEPFKPLKDTSTETSEGHSFKKPITNVTRGPGGKFISKKALEENKEEKAEYKKIDIEIQKEIETKPTSNEQAEKEDKTEAIETTPLTEEQNKKNTITTEEKKQVDKTNEKTDTLTQQFSVFRGCKIRKFYKDEQWYFSIIDILTTAKVINPEQHLLTIKQSMDANKIPSSIIELFSESIECVTYDGFMRLLPIMRANETNFSGPFPDWLRSISRITN
jgi:hypothetical protein